MLENGNFEQGDRAWTQYSELGYPLITNDFPDTVSPHSGTWGAWLGDAVNERSELSQEVRITDNQRYLRYWIWMGSIDECGYDFGGVAIYTGGAEVDIVDDYWLCTDTNTYGWVQRVVDVGSYVNQNVILIFYSINDDTNESGMLIDDVELGNQNITTNVPNQASGDQTFVRTSSPQINKTPSHRLMCPGKYIEGYPGQRGNRPTLPALIPACPR